MTSRLVFVLNGPNLNLLGKRQLNTFEPPVLEVHISNVHKREKFRHQSFVSSRAEGVIAGFGTQGYQLALRRVARLIDDKAGSDG